MAMKMAEPSFDEEAENLGRHPIVRRILDELEAEAIERAILAQPEDDQARRDALIEVRTIRDLRQRLRLIAFEQEMASWKGNVVV